MVPRFRFPHFVVACVCVLEITVSSLPAAAATPTFDPAFHVGTGAHEGQGLLVDSAGNLIATGQFGGTGVFGANTLTNGGRFDYFLAKYDPTGGVIWARRAGAAGDDFGSNLAFDGEGNILAVGTLDASPEFEGQPVTAAGKKDAFVAKYRPDGSLIWARTAGGPENDQGFGIGADAAGNVFVAGRIVGTASFDGQTVGSGSQTRFFLARYDAAGQRVWAKAIAVTGSSATGGLAVDAAGNAFITGMDAGQSAVFIAKHDADGNQQWIQRHAADTFFSEGTGIALDGSGNVYVAGRFGTTTFSVGTTTFDNPSGTSTGFVAKYTPDGTPLWARKTGSRAFDVAVTPAGVAYVTGFFNATAADIAGTTLPVVSGLDVFFARLEPEGAPAWAVPAGSANNDVGRRVALDGHGVAWAIGEAGEETFGPSWFPGGVYITRLKEADPSPTEPALSVQADGDGLIVSWPAEFSGYVLEYASELTAAFQRTGVTMTPVVGQPNTFRISVPNATLFIRLGKP